MYGITSMIQTTSKLDIGSYFKLLPSCHTTINHVKLHVERSVDVPTFLGSLLTIQWCNTYRIAEGANLFSYYYRTCHIIIAQEINWYMLFPKNFSNSFQ